MDEATDITAPTQRFNEVARTFTLPPPTRHANVAPFKDGIMELRQKGAALGLIRELLATVDVTVGTDTIARFLAEMNGDPILRRPAKKTGGGRPVAPRPVRHQPTVASLSLPAIPQPLAPAILEPAQCNPTRHQSVQASENRALPILATSDHAPCS